MTRRLTALLIPAVLVLAPVHVIRAAPATRPAGPAARPGAPAARPAVPAVRAPAGKADALPTQEEIRALYDAGDYTQVLQKMGRVLVLKGSAAKPYDRHGLLRIKGESHLRLGQASPAAAAFGDAAEAAADPKQKAVDAATELLIKRSPGLKFTAKARDKNNPPEPIDIVEAQSRKSAFLSLLEEELAEVTPRVKAARDAKQLAPILNVVTDVKGLRSVEIAATGGEEQTKRAVTDLAGHAHNLISIAIKDMAKEVDEIYTHANTIIEFDVITSNPQGGSGDRRQPRVGSVSRGGPRRETRVRKRGLERQTMDALKNIIRTCDRIGPASVDLTEAFGAELKDFKALREQAEEVGRRATKVLKDDYRLPRL